MANNYGGPRPNSGRKRGTLSSRTQEIIANFTADGKTPIQIIIEAMRYYDNLAEQEALKIIGVELNDENRETFQQVIALKNAAVSCAKDAAPYMHPKLANIEATVTMQGHEEALKLLK